MVRLWKEKTADSAFIASHVIVSDLRLLCIWLIPTISRGVVSYEGARMSIKYKGVCQERSCINAGRSFRYKRRYSTDDFSREYAVYPLSRIEKHPLMGGRSIHNKGKEESVELAIRVYNNSLEISCLAHVTMLSAKSSVLVDHEERTRFLLLL